MIATLLIIVFALILISAALSPLESLSWWAWEEKDDSTVDKQRTIKITNPKQTEQVKNYMIYFSGIGAISDTSIPQEEYPFLNLLQKKAPQTKLISNIFPYAMANKGLTGERFFARIWQYFEKKRLKNPDTLLAMVINLRNMFQMFVSADSRYGPIYNLGIAQLVYKELLNNGYQPGSKKPIIMLGWSGGGQISIGAASYLAQLGSPLYVISVGGMLSNDVGISKINKIWHLFGTKDPIQAMGEYLFAGRWPMSRDSYWNEAVREDRIKFIQVGPQTHMGKNNYYDLKNKIPGSSVTYGGATLNAIAEILHSQELAG